ncbi:hypothetical protein NDU88_010144 [Pleurodeles waltl]|uniref:Uncharacterized protein n=1 Tax=Pleurodeles waltl TaxID=8319 RepID=A0AAV7S0F0_PLEWA|nr:hypothetical protein NDU88_010144 [Pleurodeles waltl]
MQTLTCGLAGNSTSDSGRGQGLSFLNVYSLLTSRPIRIEGSRDVRGRRRHRKKRSGKTRLGGALAGSSWALLLVAGKE